jgi:hypothetical protein
VRRREGSGGVDSTEVGGGEEGDEEAECENQQGKEAECEGREGGEEEKEGCTTKE